jgi:hypothetical protein
VVEQALGPAHIRPPTDPNLPEQLVAGDVGAVQVSEMRVAWSGSSHCRAARTTKLIRQSDPDPEQYRVNLVVRGGMVVEQAGQESVLGPGDLSFVDMSRPARWASAAGQAVFLTIPRALLPLPHDELARLSGARIPGDHGTGALISSFARGLVEHLDEFGPADAARLGATAVDLVTAALAPRLQREDGLPPASQRELLLRQVNAFIDRRLGDPGCRRRASPPRTTSRCATSTSCSRSSGSA